jgi:hypothetical protein
MRQVARQENFRLTLPGKHYPTIGGKLNAAIDSRRGSVKLFFSSEAYIWSFYTLWGKETHKSL